MKRLGMLATLGLIMSLALFSTPRALGQGTTSFQIFIPRKVLLNVQPTSTEFPQIGAVRARFSVDTNASVTFKITDPGGVTQSFPAVTPASTTQTIFFPSGNSNGDRITLFPIPDSNDPNRYEMEFLLRRDSDVGCKGTQNSATNTYKIEVTAGPLITGVCLESRDGRNRPATSPSNSCTNTSLDDYAIPVPLDDPADMVATLKSPPTTNQPTAIDGCFTQRPPVDVVMVLDKSGSMISNTPNLGPTRMDALHKAVRTFVSVWSSLPPTSGDSLGGVFFDTTSPPQPAIPNFPVPLSDMTQGTTQTNIPNFVDAVAAGGATSIGAGLKQGDQRFTNTGHRKVVLLMSDGQQNTEPFVKGDGGLYCNATSDPLCLAQNVTCTTTTASCPLSNHPQLYTVTVGPSGSVDPAIAQAIATGFYLNTETNFSNLNPFFLELLQNFLRFNSYETVRIASESTPYSTTVPISTTSLNVVFSLTWANQAVLRLTVTPPGGARPIVKESGSGFISFVQQLPLPTPYDATGDWKIQVETINAGPRIAATTTQSVPFDLHVMTDDAGIKTDLAIVPGDYKSGDRIHLRAKLTRFGLPILGLGSHTGDKILAKLIRPGESIGDILSDSTESANPNTPDQSPAEAKLENTLRKYPSRLIRETAPDLTLYDDGQPEHGDDVAGDGIYNALYTSTLTGHYNFTIAAESIAPDSVRFSRQQLRTVYVRPVPDAGNTVFQTAILQKDNRNLFSIVMTPRVKPVPHCAKSDPRCGRMGPGWANYFWFTAPGQTPFKPVDNLNGTYTATLPFTGSVPPPVTVHFENVLAIIADSVPADQLPDPLGPGNVLGPVSQPPPPPPGAGHLAFFLDAGINFPHGNFGQVFNKGFSFNAGLEYMVKPAFSLEGIFGYHHFPVTSAAGAVLSDLNVYQFSANAKVYIKSGTVGGHPARLFVNFGPGGYKFSSDDTHFGGNIGAGVLFEVWSHAGLQGSYNFHAINTPGGATKFSTLQGGVRFVF